MTAAQPISVGQAARDAAPHDVLRRSPLEQHGVDDDVEAFAATVSAAASGLTNARHQEHGDDQQDASEQRAGRAAKRRRSRLAAGRCASSPRRCRGRAPVERVGAAGRERAAEQGGHDQPERRNAASARTIAGTVVTSSSSTMRSFISAR